jgi:hypothetical protein
MTENNIEGTALLHVILRCTTPKCSCIRIHAVKRGVLDGVPTSLLKLEHPVFYVALVFSLQRMNGVHEMDDFSFLGDHVNQFLGSVLKFALCNTFKTFTQVWLHSPRFFCL